MLAKKYRLRKRKEFSYIYKKGTKYRSPYLSIYRINSKELNIGFSVSKRIGKAVERNFHKRRLQHIAYDNLNLFPKGKYIVIANDRIKETDFVKLKTAFISLLNQIKTNLN